MSATLTIYGVGIIALIGGIATVARGVPGYLCSHT